MIENAIHIGANALGAVVPAVSTEYTIPNDSSGNKAKYIRVLAAGGDLYMRLGKAGAPATTTVNSMLINQFTSEILHVGGHTTMIVLGNGTVSLNVTPLEG